MLSRPVVGDAAMAEMAMRGAERRGPGDAGRNGRTTGMNEALGTEPRGTWGLLSYRLLTVVVALERRALMWSWPCRTWPSWFFGTVPCSRYTHLAEKNSGGTEESVSAYHGL